MSNYRVEFVRTQGLDDARFEVYDGGELAGVAPTMEEALVQMIAERDAEIVRLRAALEVFAEEKNWKLWDRATVIWGWMADGEPWTIAQEALKSPVTEAEP